MSYLIAITLILGGLLLHLAVHFARRRFARQPATLGDSDLDEEILARCSPKWLNGLALLPLPMILGGIGAIVYGCASGSVGLSRIPLYAIAVAFILYGVFLNMRSVIGGVHFGFMVRGDCYVGGAVLAFLTKSWWPLLVAWVLAWVVTLLGANRWYLPDKHS